MSQMQKDFKQKSKLRQMARAERPVGLADGGSWWKPSLDWLGSGGLRKAGEAMAGRPDQVDSIVDQAQQPVPTPPPAPAPQPAPEDEEPFRFADGGGKDRPDTRWFGSGLLRGAADAMVDRTDTIDKAVEDTQQPAPQPAPQERDEPFRFADGGRVNGKGGRTDDKIGPVMLSDEEYVLPADTADAIGRENLDALRLATHDFKDDRKESALRASVGLADGGSWRDTMKQHATNAMDSLGARAVQAESALRRQAPQVMNQVTDAAKNAYAQAAPRVQQMAGQARDALQQAAPKLQDMAVQAKGYLANKADAVSNAAQSGAEKVMNTIDGFRKPTPTVAPPAPPTASMYELNAVRDAREASALRRAAGNAPITATQNVTPAVQGATTTAQAAAPQASALRRAVGATGRMAGSVVKGGLGTGGLIGTAMAPIQAAADRESGYNQAFRDSIALPDTAAGNVASDVIKGLVDIGNTATGGLAERLGRGISSMVSGDGFGAGWKQPNQRDTYLGTAPAPVAAQQLAPVTQPAPQAPAAPQQSTALAAADTPEAVAKSAGYSNLGNMGGDQDVYRRGNTYVGANTIKDHVAQERRASLRDRTKDINARYDSLLRGQSQDWIKRHGASIERDRQNALSAHENALNGSRSTSTTTTRTAPNQPTEARGALTDAQRLSAQQADRKFSADQEEKGYQRVNDAIDRMFVRTGEDGKQSHDKELAQQLREFIGTSSVKVDGKSFAQMSPSEQMDKLPKFKQLFQQQMARNAAAHGGPTMVFDPVRGIQDSANWEDFTNGRIGAWEGLKSNIPFFSDKLYRTESGQLIPTSKLDEGNADRKNSIRRQIESAR